MVDISLIGLRLYVIVEHRLELILSDSDFKYESQLSKSKVMYNALVYLPIINT